MGLWALGGLWMALIPQAPPPDDPAYWMWWAQARWRFGPLFDPLSRWGLWTLSQTPGWRLLGAWLGLGLVVRAAEAGAARRWRAALGWGILLGALVLAGLERYLPPPQGVRLAWGEGRSVGDLWLVLDESGLSLWRQGDPLARSGFRPGWPLRLGPYIAVAGRRGQVLELQGEGPSGPLHWRSALDAAPVPALLLHPSPEGEAFAAVAEAGWIVRLIYPDRLTIFAEGTGAVVAAQTLPSMADGQEVTLSLPEGYALRLIARPVYRVLLMSPPTFAARVLAWAGVPLGLAGLLFEAARRARR